MIFRLQASGFRCADLLPQGHLSYELRRLRLHGLIERMPRTHRYQLTELGFRTALFFTRAYARLLRPGFAQLIDPRPTLNSRLRRPLNEFQLAVDRWSADAKLAA